jgi:hypothetical protein
LSPSVSRRHFLCISAAGISSLSLRPVFASAPEPSFFGSPCDWTQPWYSGGSFTILARGNSEKNCYIQKATLNGSALSRAWIRHSEIVNGGMLELTMGAQPNMSWGNAPEVLPRARGREQI